MIDLFAICQGCHKPSIGKKNAVKRVKNTMRTRCVLLFSHDTEKSTSHGSILLIKVDINAEKVECCPKDLASNVQGEQKVLGQHCNSQNYVPIYLISAYLEPASECGGASTEQMKVLKKAAPPPYLCFSENVKRIPFITHSNTLSLPPNSLTPQSWSRTKFSQQTANAVFWHFSTFQLPPSRFPSIWGAAGEEES